MKMNKTVAAVAAGMIAFGAFFSTSAAGIGYVDNIAALQAHPKMRQAVQKAQENFEKRSQGKSDQEKQQIMTEIQKEMNQKESSTMQPIFNDVRKAIQQVRQEKGLDIVLEQGAVVDGGVDITKDVTAKLAK